MVEKTLLEYVIEKHLGRPTSRSAQGVAYWHCPFHDDEHPSFATLPPKPQFKDRAKCWGCGWFGDIFDFLKEMYPSESWPERKGRVAHYKQLFESEHLFSPRGENNAETPETIAEAICRADNDFTPIEPARAYVELMEQLEADETAEAFALQVIKQTVETCDQCSCDVRHLLDRWEMYRLMSLNRDLFEQFPPAARGAK